MPDDVLDLREVELELCRLPEVNAARIVEDDVGRPIEVHILASREKHPKQIVRDVQSVAMATFGLDIDRRVISVVQLEGGAGEETVVSPGSNGSRAAGPPRVIVGDIVVVKHHVRCTVSVTLTLGGEEAVGTCDGSIASSARPRLVAHATMDALRQLMPAVDAADVETSDVVRVGSRDVAVTNIVLVSPPFEEFASGSALVREAGTHEAVARSVLDALNRRLPQLA